MCGLFGVVTGERVPELSGFLHDFTIMGTLRGEDSTGFFQVKKGTGATRIFKMPYSGELVAKTSGAKSIYAAAAEMPVTIGHNRFATRGAVSLENCHPFEHASSDRYVVGAHNGYFNGWASKEDGIEFNVDSDWAYYRIHKFGGQEALKKLHGAYALLWYENDGKLRMAVNGQRELHFAFVHKKNTMLIGSEASMLWAAAARNNIDIELDSLQYPEKDAIYVFDHNDVRAFTKQPYKEEAVNYNWPGSTRGGYPGHGGWDDAWGDDGEAYGYGGRGIRDDAPPRNSSTGAAATSISVVHEDERVSHVGAEIRERLQIDAGSKVIFYPEPEKEQVANASYIKGSILVKASNGDEEIVPAVMLDVKSNVVRSNVMDFGAKPNWQVECRLLGVTRTKWTGDTKVETAVVSVPTRLLNMDVENAVHKALAKEDAGYGTATLPAEDEDPPDMSGVAFIPGPAGILITSKRFISLTHEGCPVCNQELTINDALAKKIVWHNGDVRNTAMHHDCAEELGGAPAKSYVGQGLN